MNEINQLFDSKLICVNLGLERFFEAMCDQNLRAAHVDWKPPAGGDVRLMEILRKLNS